MASRPDENEWRLGWRIVAASSLANATGISLLFYTFNLFLIPMTHDLGLSRTEAGIVGAMVIVAALGAPILGRLADKLGFHPMFLACTASMAGIELALARWGSGFGALALGTALIGFIGGGSASVLLTRPVNAHFRQYRGLALGLVGIGISLTTLVVPPWLQAVIAEDGWRTGYVALAAIALGAGLGPVLLLMPRQASTHASPPPAAASDRSFLRTRDFWLMAIANICASVATNGAISQLSPMLQERGLTPAAAALGLSSFAFGQFFGKLGGGLLLDRIEPRLVATVMNAVPALAFVIFMTADDHAVVWLMLAAALLGLLQGADISVFSYFVARRFPVSSYGTIFGMLHGLSWIGTAIGVIGFGVSFDWFHGYWLAQAGSIGVLVLAAAVILLIRLPARDQS